MEVSIEKTIQQYEEVVGAAKKTALEKNNKYGQSWTVFRPFSLLEQVYIKLARVRSIQEKNGEQKINDEPIEDDFYAIINYCIFGLIRISKKQAIVFSKEELEKEYDIAKNQALELCKRKTHDYGEAWRDLHVSTMVDLSLVKFVRAMQIHKQGGSEENKEFPEIFKDILNYAIFCRIRINEGQNPLL